MKLLQISTCFEHPCAHHQENQLYQYDIWCMLFLSALLGLFAGVGVEGDIALFIPNIDITRG